MLSFHSVFIEATRGVAVRGESSVCGGDLGAFRDARLVIPPISLINSQKGDHVTSLVGRTFR